MGRIIDLTGQRFGRLVVVKLGGKGRTAGARWICHCDCGNDKEVSALSLKTKKTISCGCWQKDHPPKQSHGMTHSRIYGVWINMKGRCYNKNNPEYKDYGERGIIMCDEWKNSSGAFIKWAYENNYDENAPKGKCTLDRIDVNGNYEPSNCRWADVKIQANNQRRTAYYEYNGETHNISEWSEKTGIRRKVLYYRLKVAKWSIEKALTEPVKGTLNGTDVDRRTE